MLLNWMQTEDYYKTHSGNGPNWKEGGELMKEYLKMTDSLGIERKNTLIVKFNLICKANLIRGILEESKAQQTDKAEKAEKAVEVDDNDEKWAQMGALQSEDDEKSDKTSDEEEDIEGNAEEEKKADAWYKRHLAEKEGIDKTYGSLFSSDLYLISYFEYVIYI